MGHAAWRYSMLYVTMLRGILQYGVVSCIMVSCGIVSCYGMEWQWYSMAVVWHDNVLVCFIKLCH